MPRNAEPFEHDASVGFGPFNLYPKRRLLLRDEAPVRIGARAMDILIALVERAGSTIGPRELTERAWPRLSIEESNLRVQLSALRLALGDGVGGARYILTIPGRGYRFVAPIRTFVSEMAK